MGIWLQFNIENYRWWLVTFQNLCEYYWFFSCDVIFWAQTVSIPSTHILLMCLYKIHHLSCDIKVTKVSKTSKLVDQCIYSIFENTVAKKMLYFWLFYNESHRTKGFILLYLQRFFTILIFLTYLNPFILIFEFKAAGIALALIIVQVLVKREAFYQWRVSAKIGYCIIVFCVFKKTCVT